MGNLKINLEGIYSEEYKNEIIEAIKMITNDFPILNSLCIEISIDRIEGKFGNNFAISRPIFIKTLTQFEIILNEEAFKNENIKYLFEETRLNWNSFYYSISDVICHEYGHILHRLYIAKKLHLYLKLFLFKFIFQIIDIKIIQKKFLSTLLKKSFTKVNIDYDKKNIFACFGDNATISSMELFAECINNYYRLKNINSFRDEAEEKYTFEISKDIVNNIKEILNNT